jgi:hypothetical protein
MNIIKNLFYRRENVSEQEAAELFITLSIGAVNRAWPKLLELLKESINLDLKNDVRIKFEFAMAFVVLQENTLKMLTPKDKGILIRNHILDYLVKCYEGNDYGKNLILKYEDIIQKYPHIDYPQKYLTPTINNLTEAIGIYFCDLFGETATITVEHPTIAGANQTIYDLVTAQIVGDYLLALSLDWNWEKFFKLYKLKAAANNTRVCVSG